MSDYVEKVNCSAKKRLFDRQTTLHHHNLIPDKKFAYQLSTATVVDPQNTNTGIVADFDISSSLPEDLRDIKMNHFDNIGKLNRFDYRQQQVTEPKLQFERELADLIVQKTKLYDYQHLSIVGKALDDGHAMTIAEITHRFVQLYQTAFDNECRERAIKESIIIEWPAMLVNPDSSKSNKLLNYDCPVLINVCTIASGSNHDHPTLRIRILSISEAIREQMKSMQQKYTVSLERNENSDDDRVEKWMEGFGRIKIVKRTGKHGKQTADVNKREAIIRQESNRLIIEYGQDSMPIYDNGTLIVDFPMIGFDRIEFAKIKQGLQKFRLRIDCLLHIPANNLTVSHTLTSHQFVILHHGPHQKDEVQIDAAWTILTRSIPTPIVQWSSVRQMFEYFLPAQLLSLRATDCKARTLDREELQHLQCMLFLPLVNRYSDNLIQLEESLFGKRIDRPNKNAKIRIRDRLLKDKVVDSFIVDKQLLFEVTQTLILAHNKNCIDLEECKLTLQHSVFDWLFAAMQLIIGDKELLRLFNKKILTLSSLKRCDSVFKRLQIDTNLQVGKKVILLRLSELKTATITVSVTNEKSATPNYFDLKREEVNNLTSILMERPFLLQYDRMVQFDKKDSLTQKDGAKLPRKVKIFPDYKLKEPTEPSQNAILAPALRRERFEIDPMHGKPKFPQHQKNRIYQNAGLTNGMINNNAGYQNYSYELSDNQTDESMTHDLCTILTDSCTINSS